jgi:hypothetical protein
MRIVRWLPLSLLLLLATALAALLAAGGLARPAGWLLLVFLVPYVAASLLVASGVVAILLRRLSRLCIATMSVAAALSVPLLWQLGILAPCYPATIEGTRPHVSIRVPTDKEMIVAWGGDSVATNYHALFPDQRWAYDLVIEPAGTGSSRLQDYGCFGTEVVAPLAGKVVAAQDGLPDHLPGPPSDPADPEGNHVVLETQDGTYLVIAHLRQRSIAVKAGERVAEGQRLGDCGNSGISSEPHVHIHLQRQRPGTHPPNVAEGLPLFFRDYRGANAMPAGGLVAADGKLSFVGERIGPGAARAPAGKPNRQDRALMR